MSRILIATMPMAGHVRPLLPLAQRLAADGHDVLWYTGRKYAHTVTDSGARFTPFAGGLDWDDATMTSRGGLLHLRRAIRETFVEPIPGWVADLEPVFADFAPQAVVVEQGFVAGALAAELRGIPRVVVSVPPLGVTSVDTAPFGPGLLPGTGGTSRLRNRALNWTMKHVVFGDSQRLAERIRRDLDLPALSSYFMDWGTEIADA